MKAIGLLCLLISVAFSDDKLTKVNLSRLPSVNLLSVTSDSSNFIWIGSDQGLIRYDGETFTLYNQDDGLVRPRNIGC